MKRKLSKRTLRYKLTHNSIAALIVITLRKLRRKNRKIEFQTKYHYERVVKELNPKRGFISETLEQIIKEDPWTNISKQDKTNNRE